MSENKERETIVGELLFFTSWNSTITGFERILSIDETLEDVLTEMINGFNDDELPSGDWEFFINGARIDKTREKCIIAGDLLSCTIPKSLTRAFLSLKSQTLQCQCDHRGQQKKVQSRVM